MTAGNFVMLRADGLRLLLPQQDVGAAEYIDAAPGVLPVPGCFEDGSGPNARQVMALSAQMTPLTQFPRDRFVLTRFSLDGIDLYFAWSEVRVLIGAQLKVQPLPPSMRTADGPISGYVEHEGAVLLCSTAGQVLAQVAASGN
jgi:hypothetical protein